MKKSTVLIVDPDGPSALLLEELLQMMCQESANIHILQTSSGKEALNLCREYPIDLILTELHLKEMDGWELTQKIKALYPSITIIIQTAIVIDHSEQKFRESGADSFLVKPININEVQKKIESAL